MQIQPQNGMSSSLRIGIVPKGSFAAVILALLLLLCSAGGLGLYLFPSSKSASALAASTRGFELRFMTFNIRHAKGLDDQIRIASIQKQIEQGQADIVALQEVDRYQWRSGVQDQARHLAESLGMHYTFAPAVKHGFSEYGIALLSRYPLEQIRVEPLPGGKEPRVALTALAMLPGGKSVTVVTTHLGVSRADRELQMPQLLRIVKSIHSPVVVLGDFNMKDNDSLMKGLNTLLPKVRLSHPQSTVLHGGEIDHLFTNLAAQGSAWTEPTTASDHVPVFGLCLISSHLGNGYK